MNKRLIHILFLLLYIVSYNAQEPVFIQITEKDGLPDHEIYSILEDNEGYIWIAGNKGLFRYNGKKYEAFSNPNKRGRSFFNLKLDNRGRIWCNNIAGQFFYVSDNRLQLFGDYQKILQGRLTDFVFHNNSLVIRSKKEKTDKFKLTFIDLDSKKENFSNIEVAGTSIGFTFKEKLFYFNMDFELNSYKNKKEEFLGEIPFTKNWFTNFSKNENGFYVIRSDKNHKNTEIYVFDGQLKKIEVSKQLNGIRVENINAIHNKLYLSTNKGVYVCSINNNKLIVLKNYFKTKFVTKVIEDFNENIWVSTLSDGVYVIPNESLKKINAVNNVTHLKKRNDSLLYIVTESGLLFNYNIKQRKHQKHIISENNTVRGLSFDENSQTIFYATDFKIKVFNEKHRKTIELPEVRGLKSVDFLKSDLFLLSTSAGTVIKSKTSTIKLTNNRSYKSILSKNNGKIYISDVNGIQVFNDKFNLEKNILYQDKPLYAFDITEDNNGVIWLATYDKGVFGIKNDKVYYILNTENGLVSNITNCIKADGHNLWIASEAGLQYYNTKLNVMQTITKQDGIDSYNIGNIEILGNTVLFSSNLGLFSFDKTKVFKNRIATTPYFTSIILKDKDTIIQDKFTFKESESSIRFQFNTIGFQSNQFTSFEYQLEGLSKDWKKIDKGSNYVKFTSLPSGNFSFNLRAKNKFNDKLSAVSSIKLIVTEPYYKTWWFWFVIFLGLIFVLLFYFNRTTKRLKKEQSIALEKAQLSKDLVFSQLENLRIQMNPHFIFNALNSIQDFIILNEKKSARQYLVKFSKLIRVYLDQSQRVTITLTEEIKALNLYLELEKDRFNDDFSFDIAIDKTLNLDNVSIPSLFLQPYVENALKHGLLHKKENKRLVITFDKNLSKNKLVCKIRDNGIGRKASLEINKKRNKLHKSFSTSANQKRVDLLNQANENFLKLETIDLYENDNAAGTEVIVTIPLNY